MGNGGLIVTAAKNAMWKRLYGTTVTAMSCFKIGTGTTTPVVGDTDLAAAVAGWSGGGDTATFVSGYPTYDTINKRATTRGFVSSTQANGNTITETGLFNSDGTPIMFSHDVFNGISKTSSDEIAIVWTDTLA